MVLTTSARSTYAAATLPLSSRSPNGMRGTCASRSPLTPLSTRCRAPTRPLHTLPLAPSTHFGRYVKHTGNPHENKGHSVELRLTCCELTAALPERAAELQTWGAPQHGIGFYGTWHVRTPGYRGDAEMCLWLPPQAVPIGYVIQQTSGAAGGATGVAGGVPMGLPPGDGASPPMGLQLDQSMDPRPDLRSGGGGATLPVVAAVPVPVPMALGRDGHEVHGVPVGLPP